MQIHVFIYILSIFCFIRKLGMHLGLDVEVCLSALFLPF